MSKSIQQILAAPILTGLIQAIKPGLPNPLPPQMMSLVDKTVPANYGTYTVVEATRKTARLVQYGSPSKRVQLQGVSNKPVTLMTTAENIQLSQADFMSLRNYDNPDVQAMGEKEVARQVANLKYRLENLRLSAVASILSKGKIWFDINGDLLDSASGAATTIDYLVPTNNTGTLNGTLTNWSTTSTNIIGQIEQVKKQALQTTGYPLAHVIYGENVANYIASNEGIRNFIRASQPIGTEFYSTGTIPSKLCGLNWIPGYNMFFEAADGTIKEWFDPDAVVFIPEPSADWWGWLYGTTAVPASIGGVDLNAANPQKDIIPMAGMYAYATLSHDPVTINVYTGDVSLPVLKVPGAIFIGDCVN